MQASHTNHLCDSGMKNNPGINIVHGKIPEIEQPMFMLLCYLIAIMF